MKWLLQMPADEKTFLEAGQELGPYKIISTLGAGGMGQVYLAEDCRLDRKVALKLLPAEVAADRQRMRRFVQEAKTVSALNHPNILTIYEFGEADSRRFIAMEHVDGVTLREQMSGQGLRINEVLDISIQIATALNAAHEAGVVHRDIKPENLMVRHDRIVKVLDFGLAKLARKSVTAKRESVDPEARTEVQLHTEPGLVMGTVRYMSPEQARGQVVDARTDVWSLGIVLYEMLTGRQPFAADTTSDVIASILRSEATPPTNFNSEIPVELEHIILRTLRKEREERYQSAKTLLADLRKLQKRLEFDAELERTASPHKRTTRETGISKAVTHNSIAVLPFANMSADVENEYFCDGLAEELLNALAKIEDLKVVARTSAFSFKGKDVNVSEIGSALNVKSILEGSVRKSGNRLRITVQLVNASDGYHLWSERYDREMKDIFDVQDEIAQEITEKLRLQLKGNEQNLLTKRYTENTEAYQAYLRGRYFWNKRTEEGVKKAVGYFQQAIEIDPTYALAYTGLSDCYIVLAGFALLPPHDSFPKARAAAMKALEIDDALAEAHCSLGTVRWVYEWDRLEAEREYERALELNPNYATAYHWYSFSLAAMCRIKEAVEEIERAYELDPLSLMINTNMGTVFYWARRYDTAIETYLKALEIDPSFWPAHWMLGLAYKQVGRFAEAIAELIKAAKLSGGNSLPTAALGHAYALAGMKDKAREVLTDLKRLAQQRYVPSYGMGKVYAELGDEDLAFEHLQSAGDERDLWLGFIKIDPEVEHLRADPRFTDLIQRVGLPL